MSAAMGRIRREAIEQYGPAPRNPAEALAHTLAVFADQPDDMQVLEAMNGIYGDGVRTGLTLGDLRAIQAQVPTARLSAVLDICDEAQRAGERQVDARRIQRAALGDKPKR